MKEKNLWSDAKQSEVETAALERIDEAFEKAKNTPLSANSLMDHCFTSDTERQSRQRSFLMHSIGEVNE